MVRTIRAKRAKSSTPLGTIYVDSSDPLAPSSLDQNPTETPQSVYPDPITLQQDLPSQPPPPLPPITPKTEDNKEGRLTWTFEIILTLVEFIFGAFKKGRISDNGFKNEIWNKGAIEVNKVS
jgi:hypothetical protein